MADDASVFFPSRHTLPSFREAARGCTACPLYKIGTQTVFGEGPPQARLMLVGEQPGNEEDLEGHPFVGPAGRMLDKALQEAGVDRSQTYLTNVVKHFKWVPKGKRRLHKKPGAKEIKACLPWLEAEIELVKPEIIVVMGATAAQALLGKDFKVTEERGKLFPGTPRMLATIHPSAILRQRSSEERHAEYAHFVADLKVTLSA